MHLFFAASSHTESPVRRTSRKSLPNSVLMFRRQLMRENFLKTSESPKTCRKTCKNEKNQIKAGKLHRDIKLKTENDFAVCVGDERKPVVDDCDISPKIVKVKKETIEERFGIPENFGM